MGLLPDTDAERPRYNPFQSVSAFHAEEGQMSTNGVQRTWRDPAWGAKISSLPPTCGITPHKFSAYL